MKARLHGGRDQGCYPNSVGHCFRCMYTVVDMLTNLDFSFGTQHHFFFTSSLLLCECFCHVYMCVCMCVDNLWSQFSLYICTWVPGVKLKCLALSVNLHFPLSIRPAQSIYFFPPMSLSQWSGIRISLSLL